MDFLIDEIGKPATKIIAIVGVVAVFTLLMATDGTGAVANAFTSIVDKATSVLNLYGYYTCGNNIIICHIL